MRSRSEPRRRRVVAPVLEVGAVIAAAVASAWWPLAALIGLFLVGTGSRWARGKSWAEPARGIPGLGLAGVVLGAVALGAALVVAGPALERVTARAVEWTQLAAVRGNVGVLVAALAVVTARAVAAELVFRRWLVDRIHDQGARPIVAVACAAIVEAAVSGGHAASRAGAAVAGLGLGLLYVGAGRRLPPALACRITFEAGAVIVVWARLV